MEYLEPIGSYLPDLPVETVWQGWQFVTQIDSLYLAVTGGFLVFSLVVIIAIKKWKSRNSNKSQTTSQEKHKAKPQGIKNIKNEEAEKSKTSKWKKPDPKPTTQKQEEKSKSGWLGSLTEKMAPAKTEKSTVVKPTHQSEEEKKGCFSFSKQEDSKEKGKKEGATDVKSSFMKPVHLNIEPNPVPRDVLKKKKDGEIQRVRKMCGEFREVVKGNNKEEREEKQKEMEIVRSARSYFKTADRYRSESLSGHPRITFRTDEEVNDSYSRGNQSRLSQFTPGKINSRFTDLFDGEKELDLTPQKPPKKKIITLNQILKQGSPKSDENRISKELELEDLKESRKKWRPPQIEKPEPVSNVKDEIITLQFESMPLKLRWNPKDSFESDEIKSLEIPNKLNIEKVFPSQPKEEDIHTKIEVEKELDEVRMSRPKRFQKIVKEQRSSSAHVLQRVKLADDSWVAEKSESRIAEERRKAIKELELVKQARLQSLEAMDNMEIERPSSRLEDKVRFEALKELEEVRRARTVTMQEDEVKSEVVQTLEHQLSSGGSNQIDTKKKKQKNDQQVSNIASIEGQNSENVCNALVNGDEEEDSASVVSQTKVEVAEEEIPTGDVDKTDTEEDSASVESQIKVEVAEEEIPTGDLDKTDTEEDSASVESQTKVEVAEEEIPAGDVDKTDTEEDSSSVESQLKVEVAEEEIPTGDQDRTDTEEDSASVESQTKVEVADEEIPTGDVDKTDTEEDDEEEDSASVESQTKVEVADEEIPTGDVDKTDTEEDATSVESQTKIEVAKEEIPTGDVDETDTDISNQINDMDDEIGNVSNELVNGDDNNKIDHDMSSQINDDDDEDTASVESQIKVEVAEEEIPIGDVDKTDSDISNQINNIEAENRSEENNEEDTELENESEKEEEIQEEIQEESQEQLEERVKELTELDDIRSLDIAMAIAAEGMMEFEEFKETQANKGGSYEELDEEFEQNKKIIEEELRQIEEQYKAVQEQACQDVTEGNEEIVPTESYEELTERLLKVAESIQESAKRLGNEDIDLAPRIDRIQNLRDECQLSNLSLAAKDNIGEKDTSETETKHILKSVRFDDDEEDCLTQNEEECSEINGISESKVAIPDEQNNDTNDLVCEIQSAEVQSIDTRQNEEDCLTQNEEECSEINGISESKVAIPDEQNNDANDLVCETQSAEVQSIDTRPNGINYPTDEVKLRIPKIELTQDLGQFQPAKMNSKFKNIFENSGSSEELEIRRQPKKKLITLDQVLIKSASQDINHEKEVELEIIKTLRKNWVPPEDLNVEVSQTKLEPKKLQIDHVYGNDAREGTEKLKVERQTELDEVRQTAPLAARWLPETNGDAKDEKRSRPSSAMKVTQKDDFWLKMKSDEKVEEEKMKVHREIESIKQARLMFEDEPDDRQENDARLKTLHELESLRSNQKQTDNSVKKIKRDLEEINRNIAEKENKTVVDFQTPADQWKRERERIKETFTTQSQEEVVVKPRVTSPTKLNKITFKEDLPSLDIKPSFSKTSVQESVTSKDNTLSVETDVEKEVENPNLENKAKSKLKEIKNMEIFKLKEKTLKLTQKIQAERGRKRELKKTEVKENISIRSKSISTLKNAGQKIKSMTNEKLKVVMKPKGGEDHEGEESKVDD